MLRATAVESVGVIGFFSVDQGQCAKGRTDPCVDRWFAIETDHLLPELDILDLLQSIQGFFLAERGIPDIRDRQARPGLERIVRDR